MTSLICTVVCIETLPTIENGIVQILSNATNDNGTVEVSYQCDNGYTHDNRSTSNICRDSEGFYAWEKSDVNVTYLCQSVGKFNCFPKGCFQINFQRFNKKFWVYFNGTFSYFLF